MIEAVYELEPLTCPSCVQKIEKTLTQTDGVLFARVLFNAGKVKAEFDESRISGQKLQDIITGLGYPVKSSRYLT